VWQPHSSTSASPQTRWNYREGNAMKHLSSGAALAAALVIAAPAWAQTTPYGTQPAPYAQPAPPPAPYAQPAPPPAPYAQPAPPPAPYAQPAPYKERHAYRKHHKRYVGHMRGYHARGSSAPNDNVADQLNAQELGRMGGSPPGMPYGQPGGSYGASYGRPNQIQR
jgi:hypothetical protein